MISERELRTDEILKMTEQNFSVDQGSIKIKITPENFIKVERDIEIALREKYGTHLGTAIVIGKTEGMEA